MRLLTECSFSRVRLLEFPAYALHHKEEYYADLFAYSPEHWIVDATGDVSAQSVARARSVFAPFGHGPRRCIRKNVAYMESSLTFARILWLYDIRRKPEIGQRRGPQGSQGKNKE